MPWMEDSADDERFHRYYILTSFLRDGEEPDRLLPHRGMQGLQRQSQAVGDPPFANQEGSGLVVDQHALPRMSGIRGECRGWPHSYFSGNVKEVTGLRGF
jgi:hypothetical protein